MADISKDQMRERLGNLDQIREILVGERIRDYDGRFSRVESELASLRQEMQRRIEELKNVLSADMDAAVDSIEKKLKYLSATADEEIDDIRQQLERTAQNSSNSIAAIDSLLKSQTGALSEQLSETREGLENDIDTLKSQILKELDKRYANLGETKLSRDRMAELLFELCMRIKGTDMVVEQGGNSDNKRSAELLLPEPQNEN
ncbi:MAG: hypothetical protein F6J93_02330 [Oscillatoria sp. SIO1A7]|nr:hypothetical protein [Oscillatoria sp. SIO1A7]